MISHTFYIINPIVAIGSTWFCVEKFAAVEGILNIFDKQVNIERKSGCFRQKMLGGQQGPPCLCVYKFHVFPFETAAVADGDKVFGHGVVFFSGVDACVSCPQIPIP
jgi:hypothetical protein